VLILNDSVGVVWDSVGFVGVSAIKVVPGVRELMLLASSTVLGEVTEEVGTVIVVPGSSSVASEVPGGVSVPFVF
jgi:hypothetical protein